MARNRVNPPEQIQIPNIQDVGLFEFLKQLKFVVFQLWKRTGAGSDLIDDLSHSDDFQYLLSSHLELRQRVGSGNPVTTDTTGFTVDTTLQTTDMTEA